jgi:hypothetical protein
MERRGVCIEEMWIGGPRFDFEDGGRAAGDSESATPATGHRHRFRSAPPRPRSTGADSGRARRPREPAPRLLSAEWRINYTCCVYTTKITSWSG